MKSILKNRCFQLQLPKTKITTKKYIGKHKTTDLHRTKNGVNFFVEREQKNKDGLNSKLLHFLFLDCESVTMCNRVNIKIK